MEMMEEMQLYELNMDQRVQISYTLMTGQSGVIEFFWDDFHGVIMDDLRVYYKINQSVEMTLGQAMRLAGIDGLITIEEPNWLNWDAIQLIRIVDLPLSHLHVYGTIDREGRVESDIQVNQMDQVNQIDMEMEEVRREMQRLEMSG